MLLATFSVVLFIALLLPSSSSSPATSSICLFIPPCALRATRGLSCSLAQPSSLLTWGIKGGSTGQLIDQLSGAIQSSLCSDTSSAICQPKINILVDGWSAPSRIQPAPTPHS